MEKKGSQEKTKETPELNLNFGGKGLLGGFLKGLSGLMELADKLSEAGGIEKTGEFTVKGNKDMTGVYGFSVRTMTGPGGVARPVVRPFGNIGKVKKEPKRQGPVVEEAREPLVDVFDEGDFVRVVAELPGVAESEIHCEVQGDDVLRLETSGRTVFSKELFLESPVDPESLEKNYNNGILEVKLHKTK